MPPLPPTLTGEGIREYSSSHAPGFFILAPMLENATIHHIVVFLFLIVFPRQARGIFQLLASFTAAVVADPYPGVRRQHPYSGAYTIMKIAAFPLSSASGDVSICLLTLGLQKSIFTQNRSPLSLY